MRFFQESVLYGTVVVCSIVVFYGYGSYLVWTNKSGKDPEVLIGLVLILFLAVLVSVIVLALKKNLPNSKSSTLMNMEAKIKRRMLELQHAREKIKSIHELISSRQDKLSDIANETMLIAAASLNHLSSEYLAKLIEIEILRLINRIERIRDPYSQNSVKDLSVTIDEIQKLELDCKRMQEKWRSELQTSSGRAVECLGRLEQVPNMLNGLRDSVIAVQVRKAVQDIRPLKSFHGLETLEPQIEGHNNFQHQLDTLSAELQVLENENIRLKTEQEILNNITSVSSSS